jgi:hypothetical protein
MTIFDNDNSIAQFIFNDDYLLAKIYHYLIIDTNISNIIDGCKLNKIRLLNHNSSQIIPINFLRFGTTFSISYTKIRSAFIKLLFKSSVYYYEQHNNSFKIFDKRGPRGPKGQQGFSGECFNGGSRGAIGPVGAPGSCDGPKGYTRSNDITMIKQRSIEKSYRKFSYKKSSYQLHKVSSRAYTKNMYRKSKN